MTDATKTYFRQADTVLHWWFPEDPTHPLYAHFAEQLRWVLAQRDWRGQRVLDISTGKGRFAVNLAALAAEVTALDIAPQMLALAQHAADEHGVGVQFLQADAEQLPFPDAAFDVALCMEAIMHVPHPQRLLNEMARVTRPGGKVILSMTNRWRLNALGEAPGALYRRLGLAQQPTTPRYMWHYSAPEFKHFFERAGLTIERLHGQGLFQANARLWLNSEVSLPMFPRWFADAFFAHVEPFLRETPLAAVMGTVMAVASVK
ncbi:MAG: class I SAM-dependent methyltransferase [Anaerolineae bacterium]